LYYPACRTISTTPGSDHNNSLAPPPQGLVGKSEIVELYAGNLGEREIVKNYMV